MAAGGEFVEGWLVAQVLGEGAYGEVRLLVHSRTGASVALKAVRAEGEGAEGGAREAALHRALRHPHVLRCLGERRHGRLHYLFLEYAQGGELFDRIEPDAGMAPAAARRYWRQLADGLAYLHSRGVAHRDIKPENLLLDDRDQLKISDFGMATLFRHGSRERLLSRVCGTVPYASPEVLQAASHPYRAPPADVWSAALVLLAMLAGELPWERAAVDDPRFSAWARGDIAHGPWRKLEVGALALLRRALRPDPETRATLHELRDDGWLTRDERGGERARLEGPGRAWCSQPSGAGPWDLSAADMDAALGLSQPAQADELLALSPAEVSPQRDLPPLQRLVRRMTRVWLTVDEAAALRALTVALDERRYPWRHVHPRIVAVECGDDVRLRAWVLPVPGGGEARSVLEFRRSRGCGLAFKRRFLELRSSLSPLSAPHPPHAVELEAPLTALAPSAQAGDT